MVDKEEDLAEDFTGPVDKAPKVSVPSMDENDTSDQAVKQRIISHMNKDHALSLVDYLMFYKDITPSRGVQMRDITLEKVTIAYQIIHNKGIDDLATTIDFNPPMKSMSDAKDVLVGMAMQAAEGLGYATVKPVDSYLPPGAISAPIIFGMLMGIYFVYYDSSYINSPDCILRRFKLGGYDVLAILAKSVFWLVAAYHAVEAWILYFWTGMYRVPTKKRLAWVVSGFLEGFPAMGRFRTLMEERNKGSEATKAAVAKKD